jgi:AcrR family transcriptional regulator
MTDSPESRAAARRKVVEREILDAAWSLMAREGVAAVSVREVARSVGIRQQSLTHYYPTKQALLDALFADGFADLRRTLEQLPPTDDAIGRIVDVAVAVVDYCVANPARYHLMLQRTLPRFSPSEDSHRVALGCLNVLVERLSAAGITDPADIALIRGLISGLAAEQIANDPQGRMFADQADRGIRTLVTTSIRPADNSPRPGVKSLKGATRRRRTA